MAHHELICRSCGGEWPITAIEPADGDVACPDCGCGSFGV